VSGSEAAAGGANGVISALRDQALWRRIVAAGVVLTLSLLGASLLAATAGGFWLGDLAVHFPVQYAGLALAAFVLFTIARAPAWAALALLLAAFHSMNAAPVLAARPAPAPTARSPGDPVRVRVAAINVLHSNRQFQRVADFIHRERPDAVVLVEMNPTWRAGLAAVAREFPYRYETSGRRRGVSLWSRLPLTGVGVLPIGARQEPAVQAMLTKAGRSFRLFGVHASWPLAPGGAARRNEQLQLLARHARATAGPLVVVGDLNVSPFSPHFRDLLAAGALRSAADGYGWQPTWPSFMPPAGIQIDHALVNGPVTVERFRRGPSGGSDHLPIVVDVIL
jgi:endonuclease/exonuclease/phosphatase (EEP) superfamily protein YafD